MRHDYSTEQFQAFRQEVPESFWGQVRWRTQHALEQMLTPTLRLFTPAA